MDTLKTAAVVVLLLAVLYGVYVVLNRPGTGLPEVGGLDGGAAGSTLNIEIPGTGVEGDQFAGLEPFDPTQLDSATPGDVETTAPPSFDTPSMSIDTPPVGDGDVHLKTSDPGWGGGAAISQATNNAAAANPGAPHRGDANSFSPGYPPQPETLDAGGRNFGQQNFQRDWEAAQRLIDDGRFREALSSLSKYYQSADLSQAQHQVLLDVLDALAGKVIYSNEPLTGEPLFVVRGESLPDIARQYNVPWRLISNINGLRDPQVLLSGKQLKVVRGPFRGDVSLSHSQLTLFLDDMYAGRFDISIGDEPAELGTYSVQHVSDGRNYYSADGRVSIPAGDPRNPYGVHFLDLGRGVSIHGSPSAGTGQNLGCISLAPRDAKDVYGILSEGSTVTIRR